jgi:hypothetical protein
LATNLWSSFTSLLPLFFKGANLNHFFLFFQTWFSIWIFENLFLQLSVGGKEWLVIVDGEKKEHILDDNNTFERMEMSRGRFGASNFREIS